MVIFHTYVSLPEVTLTFVLCGGSNWPCIGSKEPSKISSDLGAVSAIYGIGFAI